MTQILSQVTQNTQFSQVALWNQTINASALIIVSGQGTAGVNGVSGLVARNPPCRFEVYISPNTAGVLSVMRLYNGTTNRDVLNSSGTILGGSSFDIVVDSGEAINLQYNTSAVCAKVSVIEIPTVV